jgi:hemolysin activation/secretion protein
MEMGMLKTALRRSCIHFGAVLFFSTLLFVPQTRAQTPPDSGTILRQIDPIPPAAPAKSPPVIQLPSETRPALTNPSDVTITVRGYRITRSTAFSEAQLLPLVADSVGNALNLQELDAIADRITRFYRDQGYLVARAYLPAQEVEAGVIEIAVIEGAYSAFSIQNRSLLNSEQLARYLIPLQQANLIREAALERSLLLIGDANGVGAITPTLSPGDRVGGSNLNIDLGDAPHFSGSVDLDNYGGKTNGEHRLGFVFNINSPYGRGDQFSLRGIFTPEGIQGGGDPHGKTTFGRASYATPLGHRGLRGGIAYSDLRYKIGDPFAALDASGDAKITSVYLAYPFIRSRKANLYIQLSYDGKRLVDSSLVNAALFGAVDVEKKINVVSWGLSGDGQDDFIGGGRTRYGLAFTAGDLKIQTAGARADDDANLRTHGNFSKAYLNIERDQRISETWSIHFAASAQESNKNLDPAEEFPLAGPNGVRAFAQGYLSGDRGYLATAELRKSFDKAPWLQLLAFFDHGGVRIDRDPLPANSDNNRTLNGAGLGFMAALPNNFALRFHHAWRLNADELAKREAQHQTWFQAVKYF